MSLRSSLYRSARLLGDAEAATKGPTAAGKRVARKAAYRGTNKALGKALRGFLK